jgi:hypothetical protein
LFTNLLVTDFPEGECCEDAGLVPLCMPSPCNKDGPLQALGKHSLNKVHEWVDTHFMLYIAIFLISFLRYVTVLLCIIIILSLIVIATST